MRYKQIIISVISFLLLSCDQLPPSKSFEDCVISKVNNAANAANESVAKMLRELCSTKHQIELPGLAVSKVEGKAGQSYSDFAIYINNRNRDWIVTEIEFFVKNDSKSDMKSYLEKIYIEPLSKESFFASIDDPPKKDNKEFSWGILKAWGISRKR